MATVDFDVLAEPVSDAEPCGPDLDLAGDADYMNFFARAEGVLPATFFSGPDGRPFDRSSIDFAAEFAAIMPLIARTRDLRLLVLLTKFLILNRDLPGFVAGVDAIAKLLEQRWDDVHPQSMDGDLGIRTAALETLDDMPPVIFPLQYAPLINHRRLGPLSYRSWMVATGEAKPREGEEIIDPASLDRALMEEELAPLVETRARLQLLHDALSRIRSVYLDRAGAEYSVKLEKLPMLAGKILSLLDGVVTKRDPSLASALPAASGDDAANGAGASSIPVGAVASMRDVAGALAAVSEYFSRFEPSSPALLLVRQAEELMGKSFLEAMRILVPTHMEQAAIRIGKDDQFDLPIERLSAFASGSEGSQGVYPEEGSESSDATAAETGEAVEEGNGEAGPVAGLDDSTETVVVPAASRTLNIKTRADAVRLLEQIGTYYRIAEPSSPVPFLTERARSFAERDFLSLLKELLPEGAFRSSTTGS